MSTDALDTVSTVLEAIHYAAAAEAVSLSVACGLDIKNLHPIIVGAAGNSKAWEIHVPELWSPKSDAASNHTSLEKRFAEALGKARKSGFPSPLGNVALQHFTLASATGVAQFGFPGMVKGILGNKIGELNIGGAAGDGVKAPNEAVIKPKKTAFVGLGSMGFGMACSLMRSGATVMGYDVYPPSVERFVSEGGLAAASLVEAVTDADVIVLMVVSAAQAREALFAPGVFEAFKSDAVVVLHSTIAPSEAVALGEQIEGYKGKTIHFVDAPVSGGPARAYQGDLTIMASGSPKALSYARSTLLACSTLAGKPDNLAIIPGTMGGGSKVKLCNQLLAGTQVAATSEALAMGQHLGLDSKDVMEHVTKTGGMSFMFGHRGGHAIEGDMNCYSANNIFVKDLGIVISEGDTLQTPVFMPAVAHQYFLQAALNGWGKDDDSTLYRLWGVNVISKRK